MLNAESLRIFQAGGYKNCIVIENENFPQLTRFHSILSLLKGSFATCIKSLLKITMMVTSRF